MKKNLIIFIIICLIVAAFGVYWLNINNSKADILNPDKPVFPTYSNLNKYTTNATTSLYVSPKFGFALEYPSGVYEEQIQEIQPEDEPTKFKPIPSVSFCKGSDIERCDIQGNIYIEKKENILSIPAFKYRLNRSWGFRYIINKSEIIETKNILINNNPATLSLEVTYNQLQTSTSTVEFKEYNLWVQMVRDGVLLTAEIPEGSSYFGVASAPNIDHIINNNTGFAYYFVNNLTFIEKVSEGWGIYFDPNTKIYLQYPCDTSCSNPQSGKYVGINDSSKYTNIPTNVYGASMEITNFIYNDIEKINSDLEKNKSGSLVLSYSKAESELQKNFGSNCEVINNTFSKYVSEEYCRIVSLNGIKAIQFIMPKSLKKDNYSNIVYIMNIKNHWVQIRQTILTDKSLSLTSPTSTDPVIVKQLNAMNKILNTIQLLH